MFTVKRRLTGFVLLLFTFLFVHSQPAFCDDGMNWWKIFGFTKAEKARWLNAGFKESEGDWAQMYRRAGVKPEIAIKNKRKWQKAGYENTYTPQQWKDNGFVVDQAIKWKKSWFR